MTRGPLEQDELAPWVGAYKASTEREIAVSAPVPDFADVLARARAIAGDRVPEAWGKSTAETGGVRLVRDEETPDDPLDPALLPFVVALRDDIERGIQERLLRPVVAPKRRFLPAFRRLLGPALVAVAMAASLVWFVWPQGAALLRGLDSDGLSAAEAVHDSDDGTEAWVRRSGGRALEGDDVAEDPAVAVLESLDAGTSANEIEIIDDEMPKAPARRAAGRDMSPTPWHDIEAEAQALWKAGDLAGAEALLLRIVSRAGRSPAAEHAYADLFTLARQRRGVVGQVAMWKHYLKRFPNGQFADDAQGGLCRHQNTQAQTRECWEQYLARRPQGSHADEAHRALAAGAP